MMTTELYPIHRCIYRNDYNSLKELLNDEKMKKKINEFDNHGNTPIHLALMLDRRNCILILLNNKCDVFTRNSCGWNPLDEAIMIGDIDILEKISYLKWKEIINRISCPGGALDEWTKVLPNLYFKYRLSIKTKIPLLQKLGARDNEEIYKKGSSFRFNTSITGIDTRGIPKVLKGSISIIGKHDDKAGVYKIYLLDNKKKLYQEFFPNIPQWYISNSLKSKMGVSTLYKFYVDVNNLNIKQKKGSVMKKTKKTFVLANGKSYKAELFRTKNAKIIIRKRKDEDIIGDYKSNIKVKVSREDEITSIFKKFEEQTGYLFKYKTNTNEDIIDNMSDSDDESSCSEDDVSVINKYDSIFNKYVDKLNPEATEKNPETVKKIYEILQNGHDESNNKVTDNDIEYLDKYTPGILKTYITETEKKIVNGKSQQSLNYSVSENSPKENSNSSDSKDVITKKYEVSNGAKDTLDWETAYKMRYPQGNDILYEMVTGNMTTINDSNENYIEEKNNNLKELRGNIITEDQYFDPSSTDKIHMGRIMTINDEVRTIKNVNKIWMTKEDTFPINYAQLSPLFKFGSLLFYDQINQENGKSIEMVIYEHLIQAVRNDIQGDRRFPLKLVVPIFTSIKAQYKALDVSVDTKRIPDEVFEIPSDYTYGNVYFSKIN